MAADQIMTREEYRQFVASLPPEKRHYWPPYEQFVREQRAAIASTPGSGTTPNDSGPPGVPPSGVPEHLMGLGDDMMAWAQGAWEQQYENMMGVYDDLRAYAGTFMGWSEADRARWEDVFKPVEDMLVADAKTYNTVNKQELEAGRATSEVTKAFGAQRENNRRYLEGMGIDPSQTRAQALDVGVRAQQGAAGAAAANNARRYVEQTGHQRLLEAAALGTDTANRAITEGQTAGQMQQAAGQISNAAFANVPALINAPLGYFELGENARQFDLGYDLDTSELWWKNYWENKKRGDVKDLQPSTIDRIGDAVVTITTTPPPDTPKTEDPTGTGTTPAEAIPPQSPSTDALDPVNDARKQAISSPYSSPMGGSSTGSGVSEGRRSPHPYERDWDYARSYAIGGMVEPQANQAIPVGPRAAGFSLDTRSEGEVTGLPHATGDQSLILAKKGEEIIPADVMEWEGRKKILSMRDKAREEMAEEEQKNPPQYQPLPRGVA